MTLAKALEYFDGTSSFKSNALGPKLQFYKLKSNFFKKYSKGY